jgi:uncharacterized protein (DUF2141 family)
MKIVVIAISIATSLLCLKSEDTATLKLVMTNITKQGKIYVAVHKPNEKFPDGDDKIIKRLVATCNSATCVFDLGQIPYGDYAIAIYQDENGNGKLDTGTFGVPKEPFAFSNNFKPRFGGPDFEKCKFTVNQTEQTVNIEMINSLFGGK